MKETIKIFLMVIGAIALLAVPMLIWNDSAIAMVRVNGVYSAIILMSIAWGLYKENE